MPRDLPPLEPVGRDLHRPECVVATPDGTCYVPDWRGGVTKIGADGSQTTWLARRAPVHLHPNSVALLPNGDFLLANLGDAGGVWRLTRGRALHPVVLHVEGRALPPTNFVHAHADGRLWISVSTRHTPRHLAWRKDVADGFIVLVDARGARIVADGLAYTNEVRPDPSGQWLVAVETFGRRLIRFPIGHDGSLGARHTVASFGAGCFPDGFAFDEAGGIWVTCLVSNRLVRVAADGECRTILEDVNPAFTRNVEEAFAVNKMTPTHLGPIPGTRLQQLTSVAFGGPDGCLVHLGSLHAACVYRFRATPDGRVLRPTRTRLDVSRSRRTSSQDDSMASPFATAPSTIPTSTPQKGHADRRRQSTARRSRVSLVDQAYTEIRRRILDNEYAPAQQVLEQELAAELGMSRTPVREALVRLEHEQFVQLIPRHGMRVVPLSLQDLRDVYDVIAVLELAAIERLVKRRPDAAMLAPLDSAVEQMERATRTGELDGWVKADALYHGALMELSGNARLAALASSMADQVRRARIATVRLRDSLDPSNHEHRVLLRAIREGDLPAALLVHTRHRKRTSDEILGILERTRLGSF